MAKKKIEPQKPAATATQESRKNLTLKFPLGGYGKSDRNIKTDIVDVVW